MQSTKVYRDLSMTSPLAFASRLRQKVFHDAHVCPWTVLLFPSFNMPFFTRLKSRYCGEVRQKWGLRGFRAEAHAESLHSVKSEELESPVGVEVDDGLSNEGSRSSARTGKQLLQLTAPLQSYILAHTPEPQILHELREETFVKWFSQMQVLPEQGQLLAMLVKLLGATWCIEVGVYTGYSSLAVAMALPESGRLVVCDKDARSLEVAKRFYLRAGVNHKVDVRCGLAVDTLMDLQKQGGLGRYDFAFIDADKRSYLRYYELTLELIRPGGLLVFDNVLWRGKVADPQVKDKKTTSLRDFNAFLLTDNRVDVCLVPVGDGMMLCRKL